MNGNILFLLFHSHCRSICLIFSCLYHCDFLFLNVFSFFTAKSFLCAIERVYVFSANGLTADQIIVLLF